MIPRSISTLCTLLCALLTLVTADLWAELQRMNDLRQFTRLCREWPVCVAYMQDTNARISLFAPTDDVFQYNPELMAMDQRQLLSHIVDQQVIELMGNTRWDKQTLIRASVQSGNVYITQFENNPGNFVGSMYMNNGKLCNQVSSSWSIISGEQYLFKVCTPIGYRGFPGSALSFVRLDQENFFVGRNYDNQHLSQLRDILDRVPDVALVIYGSNAWNGFHTFFLPNDDAFAKVDRMQVDREVLLAHVTGTNRVLFCFPWMFDGGIHQYPSVRFTSTVIEDNYKLKLSMRNITDRKTVYAVSEVYERYSHFRRGSVWAKIVQPNIPVQNGVVHIVDSVLGVVSNSIDQLLNENPQCTSLMTYINKVGNLVRSYLSATGGMITFFAPINEAFDRIPEEVERRLLRDRLWLEQILKLHIVPAKELTSDEISNQTVVQTTDPTRRLFFIKGEWPKNNITYYVLGGGVQATIMQDNVAATNGIIHYIDRVLGVPYQTMYKIVRNDSLTQNTFKLLDNLQLRYTLDPWEVVRPEQNFTFFVPTNEAWAKQPLQMMKQFQDGRHWEALQFVFKRHMIQGQALMYTDLRERTYVMMNNDKVTIRRYGHYFELYWPYGNKVARVIEGGEIGAINGFIHLVDNVLVQPEDLRAASTIPITDSFVIFLFQIGKHQLLMNEEEYRT